MTGRQLSLNPTSHAQSGIQSTARALCVKLKPVDSLVSEVLTWAMIGQALGHYRIEAKLGEGGMGVVYRAFDTHLDRPVAIKVLRADATTSPERRRRFQQEAKAASALNHPNIVHIYDIGSSGGMDYIAMEFVDGKTLDRLIGKSGLALRDTLKYAIPVADAPAASFKRPYRNRPGAHAFALGLPFHAGALPIRL